MYAVIFSALVSSGASPIMTSATLSRFFRRSATRASYSSLSLLCSGVSDALYSASSALICFLDNFFSFFSFFSFFAFPDASPSSSAAVYAGVVSMGGSSASRSSACAARSRSSAAWNAFCFAASMRSALAFSAFSAFSFADAFPVLFSPPSFSSPVPFFLRAASAFALRACLMRRTSASFFARSAASLSSSASAIWKSSKSSATVLEDAEDAGAEDDADDGLEDAAVDAACATPTPPSMAAAATTAACAVRRMELPVEAVGQSTIAILRAVLPKLAGSTWSDDASSDPLDDAAAMNARDARARGLAPHARAPRRSGVTWGTLELLLLQTPPLTGRLFTIASRAPPPTAAPAASIACVALMVQFASKPSPMRDPSPVSLSVIRAASRASLCP